MCHPEHSESAPDNIDADNTRGINLIFAHMEGTIENRGHTRPRLHVLSIYYINGALLVLFCFTLKHNYIGLPSVPLYKNFNGPIQYSLLMKHYGLACLIGG
jgi:hypothetical protein